MRQICSVLAVLAALAVGPASAQEAADKSVADLVKQLDAESFADRQAAGEELVKRGKGAIEALVLATRSESAETVTRSLDILRRQSESKEAEVKAAAVAALQKLASGEGLVARRAGELLKPKPVTSAATPPAVPGIPAPVIRGFGFGGGGIRIAAAAGDGVKRISVKDENGVKEIEVVEGDRTIKINDDPAKGIKLKVTEKKDGKEETKEYEAKNADELKTKHPEAHKLYQQYKSGGAEIRFEAIPGLLPGIGAIPAPPVPAIRRPAIIPDAKEATDRLDKARQQLDEAAARLKKLPETSAIAAAEIKAALEAIEQSKKELEALRAKLP